MLAVWLSWNAAFAEEVATIKACTAAPPAIPSETKTAMNAAVRIETVRSSGSGVVVSDDGFVLTAAHVVGGATTAKVVLADGSDFEAKVVRTNASADLALLQLPETGFPCLRLASTRSDLGAELYLIGSPGGEALTHTLTRGITSGYRDIEDWTVLQTDASVNPGASGGPMLTTSGEVVGIASFKLVGQGVEGLGFAVAVEEVDQALEIAWGAASDPEIPRKKLGEGDAPAVGGSARATVSDRPAHPGERLGTKVACKEVKGGTDPVSGLYRMTARGSDMFDLAWEAHGDAVYTTKLSSNQIGSTEASATQPGAVTLDYVFADGSKVRMVSSGGRVEVIPQYGIVVLSVDFVLSQEAVEVFASTTPTFRRWTIAGKTVDQERSARQGEKYYRPMFSCILAGMEKYAD